MSDSIDTLEVLSNAETCRYLRLDDDYPEMADAIQALHRLVRAKGLRPVSGCGKSYRFTRVELRRWTRQQTEIRTDTPTTNGPDGGVEGDSGVIADRNVDQ